MPHIFTQFAEAAADGGIFGALGIDWQMLLFQIAGFLLLVWVMGKFVYPTFMRIVDERQEKIDASVKAAHEAEAHAQKAEASIQKMMQDAKKDAADIVTTAHDEATATLEKAHAKAKADAEHIVTDAHDQIQKDIVAARKSLKSDTLELVATATEKIVGAKAAKSVSSKDIAAAIEETK